MNRNDCGFARQDGCARARHTQCLDLVEHGERAATGPHVLRTAPAVACWVTFRRPSPSQRWLFSSAVGCALAVAVSVMVIGVCDVQDSRRSFMSRSSFARPNSCILRALILLTVPSTAPELYGRVSPAVTASRSRRSPRVNERNAGRS